MLERAPIDSKLNFCKLTMLIVDPNKFSGQLTRDICLGFGFGTVLVVENSLEAIGILGSDEIDVVICDWSLHPHGGAEFIHHVRASPGIRNNCIPIVVLTAICDRETITAARDAGVHDFLTRPLVMGRLVTCLGRILGMPQGFIRSKNYVGPDRRRKQLPLAGPDRRGAGVHANSFHPEQSAVVIGQVKQPGGLTVVEMVTAGETVIASKEEHYRGVRGQDLEHLFNLTRELKETSRPDDGIITRLYLKSNDIKGMGQTFGYPLLTESGGLLCKMLWRLPPELTKTLLTIQGIETHVIVMKMIVESDIRDDGGELGAELVAGLHQIADKVCAAKIA